ncbi:MAG: PKD domain-containing protein [Bacteroidota bacterium]
MLQRLHRLALACTLAAPLFFSASSAHAQQVDTRPDPVYIAASTPDEVLVQTGRQCATAHPSTIDQARVSSYVERFAPRTFERMQTVTIPVAFHVVTRTDGTGDVPNSQLEDQIDVMNDAFAPVGFQFTLASIDRTANNAWYNHEAGSGNERAMKQALAISPETTLNFYTGKPRARQLFFLVDILGYATFPFTYPENDPLHGVVVDYQSLPGGALREFNEGDTGTHEVGHWVGLFHTFQGGCSGLGDEVADTPAEAEPFYGSNCNSNRDTCPGGGTDPITNFMDYSDDVCLSEFTSGQAARAQDLMATYRPTIFSAGGGPVNQDPTASFTADCNDLSCSFTDTSSDPDGSIASRSWNFGDGSTSSQANPTNVYASAGTYSVSLTVTDNEGATDNTSRSVTVTSGGGGEPDTTDPSLSGSIRGGQYEGTASDSESGIATITLREDTNLNLDVDSFSPGASSVDFTITLQNRRQQGKGYAVATDVAGNESEIWICSDGCDEPGGGGGGEDTTNPSVTGSIKGAKFDGTASDSGSGIASVALGSDAVNLNLSVDNFSAGAGSVGFELTLIDVTQPGSGTIVATDVAGNEGTLFVDSENRREFMAMMSRTGEAVYALDESYPNPFALQTRIGYSLAQDGPVTLTVFDLAGRVVVRLVDDFRAAGPHEVAWDGTDEQGRAVASGVYVYRIEAGSFTDTERMVIMK